jgi:DNA-directed RNA polymerase II subunit RPB2
MNIESATYILRRALLRFYMKRAAAKHRLFGPRWRAFFEGVDYLANDAKRFNICASFLQNHGLIGSQIEGFEHFVDHLLQEVIKENSDVWVETRGKRRVDKVSFIAPTVRRPILREADGRIHDIDPNEAQTRKTTYEITVLVDVRHEHMQYDNEDENFEGIPATTTHVYRNISLCQIPCMVKSKYCHWYGRDMDVADHGGYFIISGHQKNMIMLQKMRTNWPVIRHMSSSPRVTMAEIRSASGKWRSTSTLLLKACSAGGRLRTNVFFNVPFVLKGTSPLDIPLVVMLKILRIESVEDQFHCICPDPELVDPRVVETLKHALHVPESQMTREEAFKFIFTYGTGSCKDETEEAKKYYILHIFANEFLPHQSTVGVQKEEHARTGGRGAWSGRMRQYQKRQYSTEEIEQACMQKAVYIGFTVIRLLHIYLGLAPEDDRDHYSNKRLDSPASLMAYHFRLIYRTFLRQLVPALSKTLEKCPSVIDTIKTKSKAIAIAMREPYKRGNWSLQPGINNGVVQTLGRISPQASLALCRRIMVPLKKEGKIALPRYVFSRFLEVYSNHP